MEREQKRRKVGEEDEEEQKMEMFFALIRSTRDARDRLMKITEDRLKKDEQEKKMMTIKNSDNELMPAAHDHNHNHKKAVWIPTFEWEDFMEGANNNSSNTQFMNIKARPWNNQVGPSQRSSGRCQEAKEEEGNGLDLKLSL